MSNQANDATQQRDALLLRLLKTSFASPQTGTGRGKAYRQSPGRVESQDWTLKEIAYGSLFVSKRRRWRTSLPLVRLSIHQPPALGDGQQRVGALRICITSRDFALICFSKIGLSGLPVDVPQTHPGLSLVPELQTARGKAM